MAKAIMAAEIKEGMHIYVEGHLMEVKDVKYITYDEHSYNAGKTGTYFKGYCINKDDDIYKTSYNGGSYGSIDSCEWYIEV